MTNLRHLVFLDKKLVSVENRDGTSLNITSIVDVAGDDFFLFLLESSGVVWICYKPWAKFDETTHLRFVSFKSFEFEATNIFYCPLKHILIVIGREQEYDSMLKFNSYDLLMVMNNFDHIPQLIQSTPLFPNLNEFKPESNINVAISECCSIVAISTETNGIYFYKNYIIPSDDHKLYIIPYHKLFRDKAMQSNGLNATSKGASPVTNSAMSSNLVKEDEHKNLRVAVRKIHLFTVEGAYYLVLVTENELVSYNLGENSLVFKETSELKFEVSCKLKGNKFAVYKAGKILIYDVLKGLIKQISSNTSAAPSDQPESLSSNYGINTGHSSGASSNIRLCSFNEYVINCNVDNIFDNNNIILINVYSYLLDITFIAYSYYIPRLAYVVQSLGNLYLFTTNSGGANAKDLLNSAAAANNVLIFELKNKSIYERIEILIKKRLFKWAIKLAEFEKRPRTEVEEIYKIYADWLYSKNRYNESILCYCKSGGSVEPCYVIQKFLILNSKLYLYKYLYYLHLHNKDNYILTILLIQLLYSINSGGASGEASDALSGNTLKALKSYSFSDNSATGAEEGDLLTKDELEMLNEDDIDYKKELRRFLGRFGGSHRRSIKEAIVECRNTGKYEFASLIAQYQNDSQELLNILLEDMQDFEGAYRLLQRVERRVQYQAILRHHKLLLRHDIDQLLELICQIFNTNSGNPAAGSGFGLPRGGVGLVGTSITALGANALASGNSVTGASSALGRTNTAVSPNNASVSACSSDGSDEPECEITIDRVLNTFVLENEFLIRLLELFDNKNDSLLLYTIRLNLLLQQYSNLAQACGPGAAPSAGVEDELLKVEDTLLKLLNLNSINGQSELVGLLLCLLYGYKRGSIIMSIKMGYYNLPLILLDSQNESISLLEYVFNYGYNEPILYINMLKLLLKHSNYIIIKKLLHNIQNYKMLKYQSIINIFTSYEDIQFQYVHDYIRNEFKKISDVVREYNNDIKQDRMEYMSMKKNLVSLNTSYIIINNMNCSSCGLHLEYPSIHFYCKHSYHIYCIGQDNTCPKCTYNLPDSNDNEDNFFKFLAGSNDPFNYISEQFNKFVNIY